MLEKLTSNPTDKRSWYVGCEYGCFISGCQSVVYDMPDMIGHIKSAHAMTARFAFLHVGTGNSLSEREVILSLGSS